MLLKPEFHYDLGTIIMVGKMHTAQFSTGISTQACAEWTTTLFSVPHLDRGKQDGERSLMLLITAARISTKLSISIRRTKTFVLLVLVLSLCLCGSAIRRFFSEYREGRMIVRYIVTASIGFASHSIPGKIACKAQTTFASTGD